MSAFLSLLTHRSFFARAAIGITVGAVLFFGIWAASLAWLPEGFFMILPRPSISTCAQDFSQTLRTFLWNLVLTGGLTVFASLFAVNRFPLGYLIPWITFAIYGGLLGTNSFACPNPEGPLSISLSVIWTRAGFSEVAGYLLLAAALANQNIWRTPSFFSTRVDRVRSWKEYKLNQGTIFGLCAAVLLICLGAVVEMMP